MRIKKQLSLFAVIFAFSIIFSFVFVNLAYAAPNGFINFENGKEFTSNSSVQLFALVTLLSLSSSIVLLFTLFYLFYDCSWDYSSRTWGYEFTTEPSACWTRIIFIAVYNAASTWSIKE